MHFLLPLLSLIIFTIYIILILKNRDKILIFSFAIGALIQLITFKLAIEDDRIIERAEFFANNQVNILLAISYFILFAGLLARLRTYKNNL